MSLDNMEKLNFGSPMVPEAGNVPANGEAYNTAYVSNQSNLKRRRTEEYEEIYTSAGKIVRTFLSIRHNQFVYHTEDWKPRGCTMYLPLAEDIMVNSRNIEQISFENDQFFLADEKGNYVGAKPGNAIHLWRFDPSAKKLYISRSVLFLKESDYRHVQFQLETL